MKKKIIAFCCIIFACGFLYGQQYKGQMSISHVPDPKPYYKEEYNFDSTIDPAE